MDNSRTVLISILDGHTFEKYNYADQEKGVTYSYYAIDGMQVKQEKWTQLEEEAKQHDLASLDINPHSHNTA